jgi:hypothetical protein
VNEAERNELRRLVDEAKRGELEKERHLRRELRARSPGEIHRQTAERKAIFAAQLAHNRDLEQLAIVAQCGRDVYLVSVGAGCVRVLDLRGHSPSLSAPEDIYALMASEADWLPFDGDADASVAVAARMIDTLS